MTSASGLARTATGMPGAAATPTVVYVKGTGLESTGEVPHRFKLEQNYPNPFNPETTITFSWAGTGEATLTIYNIQGRAVRSPLSVVRSPGEHKVVWDGTDDAGEPVASGVYFYMLKTSPLAPLRRGEAGGISMARKMVLLR